MSAASVSNRSVSNEGIAVDALTELQILRDAVWQWYMRLDGAEDRLRAIARELVGAPSVPTHPESKDV